MVLAEDFFFAGELALADVFLLAEVGVVLALALEVGVAFDLGVVLLFLGCAQLKWNVYICTSKHTKLL